jgi:hypothetical protein
MKTIISFLALFSILLSLNCGNTTEPKNELSTAVDANNDNGIVGEWERIGGGKDKNDNRKLDDAEIDTKDPLPGGFDYLHFYANGKCNFTTDHIEATYVVKKEPKTKEANTIYIYPSGLPAGLSEKERDDNAYRLRVFSIEPNKLFVKPAHLMGQIVAYKRK